MATATFSSSLPNLFLISLFIVTTILSHGYADVDERKTYIVYMGALPEGKYSPTTHHTTILEDILESSSVLDALVTSYNRSFNGFAAKLTEAEREKLSNKAEVVSIFPSRTLQLQTSRSWDFMGLLETSKRNHLVESDMIIGVIDSGIWSDSPSFSDAGFSLPPTKWKGVCDGGKNFTCNKKVIGARNYINSETATDVSGHGSHTTSIAAGNSVNSASFFGVGTRIARGGVPSARIAVYKVCSGDGCREEYILSAFDDAIADGVDIITISIGSRGPLLMTEDSVAIGSFHAMTKNILTMQGAGNSGPRVATVSSVAPWLFSVAASNTDRRFVSKVVLGNKKEYIGFSINSFSLNETDYPIYVDENIGQNYDLLSSMESSEIDDLDPKLAKGKIVLDRDGFYAAFAAGAAGAITMRSGPNDKSTDVPFPASYLSPEDFESVVAYYNSTKDPRANIFKSEGRIIGSPPEVASFSSRGPNTIIPDILKPDISAPGVDILAAYSMVAPISESFTGDGRHTIYNVLSGTSMACPHVAGAAAYVKTFHPDWSPSAIKSAIMTTAWPMTNTNESDSVFGSEFTYGSGHIDPVKAVDPGLVYEITKEEYVKMLCDIGLNQNNVRSISGDNSTCPQNSIETKSSAKDLNYPSMTANINTTAALSVKFTRTVTNVGSPHCTYSSTITKHDHEAFQIIVEPSVMNFESIGEKKTFTVTVTSSTDLLGVFHASLIWSDGVHNARSPIVLYKNNY